jgi:hypothetical protein
MEAVFVTHVGQLFLNNSIQFGCAPIYLEKGQLDTVFSEKTAGRFR